MVLRYDTISEFNMNWTAEPGQLNLAHVNKNKIYKYKKPCVWRFVFAISPLFVAP